MAKDVFMKAVGKKGRNMVQATSPVTMEFITKANSKMVRERAMLRDVRSIRAIHDLRGIL